MDRLSRFNEERRSRSKDYDKTVDKNRLKDSIKKQMTTLLIGCLARFEEHFGSMWGHGLSEEEKTDSELDKAAIWKICREKILDFGNDKINYVQKDLNNYNVESVKFQYIFTKDKESKK